MGRSTLADVRIELADVGKPPRKAGEIVYQGGSFVMLDALGQFDPRAGGALPTPGEAGEVLLARTDGGFVRALPLTGPGWLVSDGGYLLEVG